jgi:predicted acetyltransferase
MSLEVRNVREDELTAFIESMSTAFLERPAVSAVAEEVKPLWDLTRVWGAFEGDRPCGTFRSWATEITVPGGAQLPAAAISGVTVLPTHRRRGVLRAMVAAEHGAIRDRGEVAGLLYASEYPIYGRFGYGRGCQVATWSLDTRSTGFHAGPSGTVELVQPGADSRDAIMAVYDAVRLRQPGEIRRRPFTWEFDLGLRPDAWGPPWKGFLALHRDVSGAIDGYARYHADGKWEDRQPRGVLIVDELHALTDEANVTLWRFLADVDWITSLKAERRSPADRLPWLLTNARAAVVSEVGDGLWVRLFDIPRALEARTYERTGSLVLEVHDGDADTGRTRVHLDAGPDGATCRPSDQSPDLTIHVAALGAAYLGGTALRDAVIATGADEHRAGALAEAGRLFRTLDPPWCSTFF